MKELKELLPRVFTDKAQPLLTEVYLDSLGRLVDKYPAVARDIIACFTDLLTVISSSRTPGLDLQRLRDRLIVNLSRALKAGSKSDQHIVGTFLASVSNRLYTADRYQEENLLVRNTVLCLGHIAVTLRQQDRVAENILRSHVLPAEVLSQSE